MINLIWRQRSFVKHFCIFQSKKCRAIWWYSLTEGSKQNTCKWDWSPCHHIISELPTASMAVSCSQHTVRGGKVTRRGHHSFWFYGWSPQIQVLLEACCLSQGQVSGQNISLASKKKKNKLKPWKAFSSLTAVYYVFSRKVSGDKEGLMITAPITITARTCGSLGLAAS